MGRKSSFAMGARQTGQLGLTGIERHLDPQKTIVSKTDLKGIILYANKVFQDISGFSEEDVLGVQHSVVRHPHMPRVVFKLLWDTVQSGQEIFAYVNNRCKNGDNYWVLAHVTPSYSLSGELIGYHSSRRAPRPSAIAAIEPIYKTLLDIEEKNGRKEGMQLAEEALRDLLKSNKIPYDKFILSL